MPKPSRPEGGDVRLQTFLARAGVASRRACEELIAQGRVSVNGSVVTAPGTKVRPGVDRVAVDDRAISVGEVVWLALNKPRGYVSTRRDPFGRKTIYELLPERYHSLFHVGRLDRDSEGLLLLTNDGETSNRLLHPSHGTTKEYLVDTEGKLTSEEARRLVQGVEIEDGTAHAESVDRLHQVDENVYRVRIVLKEGKKREIRRMMDVLGHPVKRLQRVRFGPVDLGQLPAGKWRIVAPAELAAVREGRQERRRGGAQRPVE